MNAVKIITGSRDSGKTLKIQELYRSAGAGDGFVSLKCMQEKIVTGYDLMRLDTGEKWPLARRKDIVPVTWDEINVKGSFSFSEKGIAAADDIIDDLLRRSIEPVFMDEIGRLELQGGGFQGALKRLIGSGLSCVISVRKNCLYEVIRDFSISQYLVIDVEDCS